MFVPNIFFLLFFFFFAHEGEQKSGRLYMVLKKCSVVQCVWCTDPRISCLLPWFKLMCKGVVWMAWSTHEIVIELFISLLNHFSVGFSDAHNVLAVFRLLSPNASLPAG